MDGLHLTTAHRPTDTRIFDKEATSLSEAGFDVGILAHDTPTESQNGIEFFNLGSASTRVERWRHIPKAARIAKRLDAEVYHFHDPELIPVGLYLAESTDGAVVYDVHEDYGHVVTTRGWIPDSISPSLSYLVPEIESRAVSRFDAIVTVSDWIAAPFQNQDIPVGVAHNFPRTEILQRTADSVERDQTHVLCYVGGIHEIRGIYRMLDLLNTLLERGVDVELWALGAWGPDKNRQQVAQYIQRHELGQYVQFPGYLAYEDMFQYLHSADVGLALLDVEHYEGGIPTKFFEYLYAGLPIVTTPVDAVSAFMPDEYCHVVQQGDTEATANAVENALKRDCDTTAMQSLVETKFSWESEAKKLVEIYEDII